jgi:hypothetical protein
MLRITAALLLAAPLAGADAQGEKQKSGFDKGTGIPTFEVRDVTGPHAGKDPLCYV